MILAQKQDVYSCEFNIKILSVGVEKHVSSSTTNWTFDTTSTQFGTVFVSFHADSSDRMQT